MKYLSTRHLYGVLTMFLLAVSSVSCAAPPTGTLAAGEPTASPTTVVTGLPATGTEVPRLKPARSSKTPGSGQESQGGQAQGSVVSQVLSFDIPVRSLDVILGRPTDTSIAISVLAYSPQTITIGYGTRMGSYTSQTGPITLAANAPQLIELTALQPDTQYFYSINGVENSFHTARAAGSPFTFVVQADSHLDANTDPQTYLQTLANETSDRPDFVIDLGDTFMTEKYKPYTDALPQYLAQRYFLGQVAQSAPLFLALGNHDGEGSPRTPDGLEVSAWAVAMRTRYFPNPLPDGFYTGNEVPPETGEALQDYYAWEWGDALFVVLDPYWFTPAWQAGADPWNQTLGEEQYRWLKATLENSQAKWKFVFIHQLVGGFDQNGRGGVEAAGLYEWGGHNPDGSWGFEQQRPDWEMPIHALLVANRVTAVFHGHDHLFAAQELDGILYQEVPQPGATRPDNTTSAAEYGYLNGVILGSSGHVRVMVSPQAVTVAYVRSWLPEQQTAGRQNSSVDYACTIRQPGDCGR